MEDDHKNASPLGFIPMQEATVSIDREALQVAPFLELAASYQREVRAGIERVWDEDEAMMMRRDALLARPAVSPEQMGGPGPLSLGPLPELRRRLPLLLELEGNPFRIVELEDGALAIHGTICPHWLGPLEQVAPQNGIMRCP